MGAVPLPVSMSKNMGLWSQVKKVLGGVYKSYTFRVTIQGFLTLWVVTTCTFYMIRKMPNNPIQVKIEEFQTKQNLPYEEARAKVAGLYDYDPDAPFIEQYMDYMGDLAHGNLGKSITTGRTPVSQQITKYLPWTLFAVGMGLLISFVMGVLAGAAMAYWRGSVFDNVMTAFASISYGIPDFVIAFMILLIGGIQLEIFKVGDYIGGVDPQLKAGFNPDYIQSLFKHALLPVTTYVLASVGGWMLTMKSSTISTLGEDYITVAHARGLSQRRILFGYVGRNAMLPLMTRLAISVGFILSGSIIIETIFIYPGLGKYLFEMIGRRDYTTIQGIFLVTSAAVVVSNILADLLFGVLDPRVRVGGK
ncbi:MAG: ABC transporter permease [Chloroflexi bacterium]|nr:ABC transporter permease [Chloroflexota bacterium]